MSIKDKLPRRIFSKINVYRSTIGDYFGAAAGDKKDAPYTVECTQGLEARRGMFSNKWKLIRHAFNSNAQHAYARTTVASGLSLDVVAQKIAAFETSPEKILLKNNPLQIWQEDVTDGKNYWRAAAADNLAPYINRYSGDLTMLDQRLNKI